MSFSFIDHLLTDSDHNTLAAISNEMLEKGKKLKS